MGLSFLHRYIGFFMQDLRASLYIHESQERTNLIMIPTFSRCSSVQSVCFSGNRRSRSAMAPLQNRSVINGSTMTQATSITTNSFFCLHGNLYHPKEFQTRLISRCISSILAAVSLSRASKCFHLYIQSTRNSWNAVILKYLSRTGISNKTKNTGLAS